MNLSLAAFSFLFAVTGATFDDAMRFRSGDIQRVEASRRMIESNPTNELGYFGLAYGLFQMGRNEDALAVYDRMLTRDAVQTYHYVHSDRAVILMRLGRYEEARAALEEALRLEPSFPHAHFNLAVLLSRTGSDPTAMLAHLEKADANDAEGLAAFHRAYRGVALFRLGRAEEALAVLEQAIGEMPRDFDPFNYPSNDCEALYEARYWKARTLFVLGRRPEGVEAMEDLFRLRAERLARQVRSRSSNRPTGNWPCYEDPDRFVTLLHRLEIP